MTMPSSLYIRGTGVVMIPRFISTELITPELDSSVIQE